MLPGPCNPALWTCRLGPQHVWVHGFRTITFLCWLYSAHFLLCSLPRSSAGARYQQPLYLSLRPVCLPLVILVLCFPLSRPSRGLGLPGSSPTAKGTPPPWPSQIPESRSLRKSVYLRWMPQSYICSVGRERSFCWYVRPFRAQAAVFFPNLFSFSRLHNNLATHPTPRFSFSGGLKISISRSHFERERGFGDPQSPAGVHKTEVTHQSSSSPMGYSP
jgi:hypothetical protein